MKKSILIALLATLSFSTPPIWAQEAHDPDHVAKPATTMTEEDKHQHMHKMQEKMLQMHEQMHKITQSKDAKEREKLMQEHAQMMKDHMSMMHGMMGSGMKGGNAKCGKMNDGA